MSARLKLGLPYTNEYMADIQFEEDEQYRPAYGQSAPPLFIRWVLKTGIVKDEKQARTALLIIVGVLVAAALGLLMFGDGAPVGPTKQQQAQFSNMPHK